MVSISAKITEIEDRGETVEFILTEHEGSFFTQSGNIKIVCDRQATIDLNAVVRGRKVKGGSMVASARTLLQNTVVELKFNPK